MASERISLPQSGGGIVRYFEDFKTKIELSPVIVIIAILLVTIIEIILYASVS